MNTAFLTSRARGGLFNRIVNTEPANLIGYWPLDETSGTVARDYSGRGNNGAHSGVTLGQPGIGDGCTSPLYDGSTSYTNIYSTALAAAFNGAEGTLLIWAKVANAGVWADNANVYRIATLTADANNYVDIQHYTTGVLYWESAAGATAKSVSLASLSTLGWMCIGITGSVSADQLIAYYNGAQTGSTQTGLGTWVGALAAGGCLLGTANTGPAYQWSGSLAHCALWSKALTPAQIAYIGKP